ncbi:MAG: 2Fe-2S iron-sulfur cluster binding domain-containing protein, partial [Bacteroidales bacterium]|nr:2Fe-2S iron-sulfur cluster binding domain-containing protein [Bacteroidales bacterium]
MMNLFSPYKIPVDKQIILKILDCKHGSNSLKIVDTVYETILEKAYSLIQPKGIINAGEIPDFFNLREKENYKSGIFCIATLGKEISEESSSLFSAGEYLEGLLLDTIADQMLINLTTAIYLEKILPFVRKKEVGVSYSYIPGCQNVPIEYQKHILDLVGSEAKNEISITEGMMLNPVKSTAYFYVMDKSLPVRIIDRDCRKCDMKDCKYRTVLYVGITIIAGEKKTETTLLKEMTLLEGLREQGWGVEAYCNGAGYCGKCKVLLSGKVPEPGSTEKEMISQKELQKGIRLACRVNPMDGMVVHLPEKTKTGYQIEQGFRYRKEKRETNSTVKSKSSVNIIENGEYGIAVDIGTTTVAIVLVNLITGKT